MKNKKELRSSSISSSNISLISESTSSGELIGWSYQQTSEGKLYNMTKDIEWRQLYKSRYINERVEAELVEFKDEIEKKFKISKCKSYTFPRGDKKFKSSKEKQSSNKTGLDPFQSVDKTSVLFNKKIVFDYKMNDKDQSKINKKNIEFFNKKHEKQAPAPKKLTLVKTFDEDNKQKVSKSVPRNNSHSKGKNK